MEQSNNRLIKKEMLNQLTLLSLPLAFQSMFGFMVDLLGTVMLGALGEVEISAAALSNQVFLILSLLIFGCVGGSNVLVAQLWGQGNKKDIHKVLAYTYRIGVCSAMLFALGAYFAPDRILSVFTRDSRVIREGISYLRIISVSYVFYAVVNLTTGTLRAVGKVKIAVILSAASLLISGFLNWVFIFGALGNRPMGVKGAALATAIARGLELVCLLFYMVYREDKLKISIKSLWRIDKTIGRKYFTNTLPVIFNELFWAVGSSVLAVIMGRLGTEFVAANSIFSVTGQIASVIAQGFSAAAAIMIGNAIGFGDTNKVLLLKKMLQAVGLVTGIGSALVILGLRPFMLSLYHVNDLTLLYANQIMYTGAVIQVFKTAQGMNMMGILRGGGDARFVMINDIVFLWLLAIPLGFLAGLVFRLPIPVTYAVLNIEQFIKLFTSGARLKGNQWIKRIELKSS